MDQVERFRKTVFCSWKFVIGLPGIVHLKTFQIYSAALCDTLPLLLSQMNLMKTILTRLTGHRPRSVWCALLLDTTWATVTCMAVRLLMMIPMSTFSAAFFGVPRKLVRYVCLYHFLAFMSPLFKYRRVSSRAACT